MSAVSDDETLFLLRLALVYWQDSWEWQFAVLSSEETHEERLQRSWDYAVTRLAFLRKEGRWP